MKKIGYLFVIMLVVLGSCKKDSDETYATYAVSVQVQDVLGNNLTDITDIEVKLTSTTNNTVYTSKSDASGQALFNVPAGLYQISAAGTISNGAQTQTYNATSLPTIQVPAPNSSPTDVTQTEIKVDKVVTAQLLIKEIFVGGTPKDDGSGSFNYDKYVVLYNNSTSSISLNNICLATAMPYNSTGSNNYVGVDGNLIYASEGWMPAGQAFWYFQSDITLEAGKQIVVALNNAVNNTVSYSKSINFDNADYYCTYDITQFSHAATYVAPAASIPSNHYLKAAKYGAGTAWTLSGSSPGFFIFKPENISPVELSADVSYDDLYGVAATLVSKKIPVEWIVDGVESYLINGTNNQKRFTPTIDAGYVYHLNSQGYSIYRNVDKAATEAIAANAGKIVYNYSLGTTSIGTGGTTDPSGIDAEASIKNGALIIYQDTNNSTKDFHLRSKASLRSN